MLLLSLSSAFLQPPSTSQPRLSTPLLRAAPRAPTPVMRSRAEVLFVAAEHSASPLGGTSPEPSPPWGRVARHLSRRLPAFDAQARLSASFLTPEELPRRAAAADVLVVLGVKHAGAAASLQAVGANAAAIVAYDCAEEIHAIQRVGPYVVAPRGVRGAAQAAAAALMPWGKVAQGKRLCEQAAMLFGRNSSEDALYALFFILHALVLELDIVKYTVNPTWEKGPLRNAQEFWGMCTTCGAEIREALTDPETKATIDLLNACDMRDQVGSYRIIVSYETPQLEQFSLCLLQKNNVFGCDARILDEPRVPLLSQWRGERVDQRVARQLFIGHFECDEAHPMSRRLPWSWKVVCGANPAYDAFPAQHQIFYPSKKSSSALWYDPVFKVETLDGRSVWTKRHYRCMPRQVPADLAGEDGSSAGAWTLTTLDNGVVSKEHWSTVDAADDLSWIVFHYSGAAAVVGQSYLGGLLCSADGRWPRDADYERIAAAFRRCGIEMWELYGHGPPGLSSSFMWTPEHEVWEQSHPPPLDPIGDQTVQAWRASSKKQVDAA